LTKYFTKKGRMIMIYPDEAPMMSRNIEKAADTTIIINPTFREPVLKDMNLFKNKETNEFYIDPSHKIHIFFSRITHALELTESPIGLCESADKVRVCPLENFICICKAYGLMKPIYVHYPRNAHFLNSFFREYARSIVKPYENMGVLRVIREKPDKPIIFKIREYYRNSIFGDPMEEKTTAVVRNKYMISRVISWSGDSVRKCTREYVYPNNGISYSTDNDISLSKLTWGYELGDKELIIRNHSLAGCPAEGGAVYDPCYY